MGSVCFKAQKEAEEGEREQNKSREEQRQQAQPESGQSQQQQQQQQEAEGAVAEKRQQEQPQSDEQRQPSDGAVLTDQGPGKAQPSEQQQAAHGDRAAESNGIPAGPAASQPLVQPQPQAQPQQDTATESSAAPAYNSSDSSRNNNTSGGGTGGGNGSGKAAAGPEFRRMALEELMAATNNFSEKNVVSEGGRQALNVVYRGVLGPEGLQVAVKRFQKKEWEDAQQFAADATAVGSIRYLGLTSLLGFCCEGEHRLLVSEFMPNCTLAQHLFHWEQRPMSWLARLAVAMRVAQALEHLGREEGMPVYHDLNPYKVLLDKVRESLITSTTCCPIKWLSLCMYLMLTPIACARASGRRREWLCIMASILTKCCWISIWEEKGMPVYHDLNPYKVLLDKDNEPKLSCFGLIKPLKDGRYSSNLDYLPPEQLLHGRVTAESVVYSFGLILLALFSGKSIRPTQVGRCVCVCVCEGSVHTDPSPLPLPFSPFRHPISSFSLSFSIFSFPFSC
ncbi:unnamed protein product [Closterium sp. NIES-53]